jgi:sugar phosphate isomerase/epimerase
MANKGIEPPLDGYTEEDGFPWVIEAYTTLARTAAQHGVLLGLENHWGLGISAAGVIRIIKAVNSPWLRATLDTGNFLVDHAPQVEALAPYAALVQAKTYDGGGRWYTLEIDNRSVAHRPPEKPRHAQGRLALRPGGTDHSKVRAGLARRAGA